MVHFPRFAPSHLCIQWEVVRFYRTGFPHSEIPGSKPACGSPRLIAACHVLHRHLLPRHPPCALSSLTIKFTQRNQPFGRITRRKLHGAISLIAESGLRLHTSESWFHHQSPAINRSQLSLTTNNESPTINQALIKFTRLVILYLPNLFSCQTSSSPDSPMPALAG